MNQEQFLNHLLLSELIEAVMKNDIVSTRYYLENGADPNGAEDAANLRPLHIAVANKSVECVELLLTAGANPYEKMEDGMTPIDYINSIFTEVNADERITRTIHLLNKVAKMIVLK